MICCIKGTESSIVFAISITKEYSKTIRLNSCSSIITTRENRNGTISTNKDAGGILMRRSRLDITLAILKIAMNGAKKTQIVYGANLNSTIANKYLTRLEDKELIEQKGNIFITTDKGRVYKDLASELDVR
jgi:predicted transcriptional regulator